MLHVCFFGFFNAIFEAEKERCRQNQTGFFSDSSERDKQSHDEWTQRQLAENKRDDDFNRHMQEKYPS